MTFRAATRCWGLALAMGTMVPPAVQSTPPASHKPANAVPTYEFAWSTSLGSPGSIQLAPDGASIFAIDGEEGLTSYAADDGRRIWTLKDVAPDAKLAAGDGLLYLVAPPRRAATGDADVPGRVEAVDQKDGRRVWSATLGGNLTADPLAVSGAVLVARGVDLQEYAARDGAVSWQRAFEAPATALAVDGDRLFVALANQSLLSLDRRTHAVLHHMMLETAATALVATAHRVIVCGTDGSLSVYQQDRDGPYTWRVLRAEPIGRPVADARHVYVAQFDNTARAYDIGNGTERWRLTLFSRPVADVQIAAGRVFFPLLSGSVATAVAGPRTGQPSGEIPFPNSGGAADQRLRLGGITADGRLIFRLTRPSSHPAWSLSAVTRKDG